MAVDNKGIVNRFFEEMCNGRKLALADELFTPSHVYHDPSSPRIGPGPQGMQKLISTYQEAFADAHWSVDETITAGDTVISRWTAHATHTSNLEGIGPTGRKVKVAGIWIHRFSGGKIAESWNVWDTLGMFQQLGVIPAMGHASGGAAS